MNKTLVTASLTSSAHAVHPTIPWMAATLDGLVKEIGAVFQAKFMLPSSFLEEAA